MRAWPLGVRSGCATLLARAVVQAGACLDRSSECGSWPVGAGVEETLLLQLPSQGVLEQPAVAVAAAAQARLHEVPAISATPQTPAPPAVLDGQSMIERLAAPFGVSLPAIGDWRRTTGAKFGQELGQEELPKTDAEWRSFAEFVTFAVATLLVQVVLVGSLGQFYQHEVSGAIPQLDVEACRPEDGNTWRTHFLGGVCLDRTICLWSFCFPCARWADSMSKIGITGFWTALSFIALGMISTEATDGLFWVLFAAILVRMRQKLRHHFGMDADSCSSCATDCVAITCCFPCAVAQDAYQVELSLADRRGADEAEAASSGLRAAAASAAQR